MTGVPKRWIATLLAAAGLLLAASAHATDEATYKCGGRSGVTYTDLPCTGGRALGAKQRPATDKDKPVPQDRAVIAKRAVLSPQARQECKALDLRLREQKAELKEKGDAASLQDEMPLVQSKKRFRELKC